VTRLYVVPQARSCRHISVSIHNRGSSILCLDLLPDYLLLWMLTIAQLEQRAKARESAVLSRRRAQHARLENEVDRVRDNLNAYADHLRCVVSLTGKQTKNILCVLSIDT